MRHKDVDERNMYVPTVFALSRSGKVAIGTLSYWEVADGYYVSSKPRDPHPKFGFLFTADEVEYVSENGQTIILNSINPMYYNQFEEIEQ